MKAATLHQGVCCNKVFTTVNETYSAFLHLLITMASDDSSCSSSATVMGPLTFRLLCLSFPPILGLLLLCWLCVAMRSFSKSFAYQNKRCSVRKLNTKEHYTYTYTHTQSKTKQSKTKAKFTAAMRNISIATQWTSTGMPVYYSSAWALCRQILLASNPQEDCPCFMERGCRT